MPDLELKPGEYTERKPKGWRWRLQTGHTESPWPALIQFVVASGFVVYFLTNLPAGTSFWVVAGTALFAFFAGAMLMLWTRR